MFAFNLGSLGDSMESVVEVLTLTQFNLLLEDIITGKYKTCCHLPNLFFGGDVTPSAANQHKVWQTNRHTIVFFLFCVRLVELD